MQNAECRMQNLRAQARIIMRNYELGMRNFGAKPIILISLNCSYAKPSLPSPREGDHAFGVVVGSSTKC